MPPTLTNIGPLTKQMVWIMRIMDAIQVTTCETQIPNLMSEIIVGVVSLGALEGQIVPRRAVEVAGA